MDKLTAIVIISELLSLFILVKIWRASDYLVLKILLSLVSLTPILGPIFYFIAAAPPKQPRHLQDKPSDINHLGGYGRYTEFWDEEKARIKKKIQNLEKQINEENKNG